MSKYADKKQRNSRTLEEQLHPHLSNGDLRPRATRRPERKFTKDLRPCTWWKGDGEDHIRIGSDAETDLGITLTPHYRLEFVHDVFGKLNSISQLWTQLDHCVGGRAITIPESNTQYMLADALYQRVKQFPRLAKAIYDSELPFDFYDWNDRNIPFRRNDWWLEAVYAIRDALQSGKEYPDFSSLITDNTLRGLPREEIVQTFIQRYIPNHRGAVLARKQKVAGNDAGKGQLIQSLSLAKPQVLTSAPSFSIALTKDEKKPRKMEPTKVVVTEEQRAKYDLMLAKLNELFTKWDVDQFGNAVVGIQQIYQDNGQIMAEFEQGLKPNDQEQREKFSEVVGKMVEVVKSNQFVQDAWAMYHEWFRTTMADPSTLEESDSGEKALKSVRLLRGYGRLYKLIEISFEGLGGLGTVVIELKFFVNGNFQLYIRRPTKENNFNEVAVEETRENLEGKDMEPEQPEEDEAANHQPLHVLVEAVGHQLVRILENVDHTVILQAFEDPTKEIDESDENFKAIAEATGLLDGQPETFQETAENVAQVVPKKDVDVMYSFKNCSTTDTPNWRLTAVTPMKKLKSEVEPAEKLGEYIENDLVNEAN